MVDGSIILIVLFFAAIFYMMYKWKVKSAKRYRKYCNSFRRY